MVQSIKTSGQTYPRNVFYNVINSAKNIVYNFYFETYPNQIVYFESNSNVFSKLPAEHINVSYLNITLIHWVNIIQYHSMMELSGKL